MTRLQAKQLLDSSVLQAWANGSKIEARRKGTQAWSCVVEGDQMLDSVEFEWRVAIPTKEELKAEVRSASDKRDAAFAKWNAAYNEYATAASDERNAAAGRYIDACALVMVAHAALDLALARDAALKRNIGQ